MTLTNNKHSCFGSYSDECVPCGHNITCKLVTPDIQEDTTVEEKGTSFSDFITRHKKWALGIFGSSDSRKGLIKHIESELKEIAIDPTDTEEWIDVIILAIHGAWRTGASSEEIVNILDMKMSKNERRVWPDKDTVNPDEPVEHIKDNINENKQK